MVAWLNLKEIVSEECGAEMSDENTQALAQLVPMKVCCCSLDPHVTGVQDCHFSRSERKDWGKF